MTFARWKIALTLSLLLGAAGGGALAWPARDETPPPPVPARVPARPAAAAVADPEPPKPLEWSHQGGASALAWSGGGLIATAGRDKTVRLWVAGTGREARAMAGHQKPVRAVAFSPDGRMVASGDDGGQVRLWDMASGKLFAVSQTPLVSVRSLAFSPDGVILAVAGQGDSAQFLDAAVQPPATPGRIAFTLKGGKLKETVHSVAFSPDGKRVLLGGLVALNTGVHWNTFHQIELGTGKVLANHEGRKQQAGALRGNTGRSWPVAISPDGKLWAGATCDRTITLGGDKTICGHQKHVTALTFTPNGKQLLSAGEDGVVIVTDLAKKEVARLTGQGAVTGLTASPDGKKLAWVTEQGAVKVADLAGLLGAAKKK